MSRFGPDPGTPAERVVLAVDAAEDAEAPVCPAEIARRAGVPYSTARSALLRWRPDSGGVVWAYTLRGPRAGTRGALVVAAFDADERATDRTIAVALGCPRSTVRKALWRWRALAVQARIAARRAAA